MQYSRMLFAHFLSRLPGLNEVGDFKKKGKEAY